MELKIWSILLIIMVGVDILLLILDGVSRKFNPFIVVDDIAVLTMSIIYLVLISKGMSTNHRALGYATIIVWFFGFALKLTGIIYYINLVQILLSLF